MVSTVGRRCVHVGTPFWPAPPTEKWMGTGETGETGGAAFLAGAGVTFLFGGGSSSLVSLLLSLSSSGTGRLMAGAVPAGDRYGKPKQTKRRRLVLTAERHQSISKYQRTTKGAAIRAQSKVPCNNKQSPSEGGRKRRRLFVRTSGLVATLTTAKTREERSVQFKDIFQPWFACTLSCAAAGHSTLDGRQAVLREEWNALT